MTIYITLLRGINVGGHKKMKMADLRDVCTSLGFPQVQTYVQSGNLVLSTDANPQTMTRTIREAIKEHFGFEDVALLTYSLDDWQKIIAENPFLQDVTVDPKHLHVTLFVEPPAPDALAEIEAFSPIGESFSLAQNRVYLHCPNGYGRSKLTNAFWERKLNVQATTRNWNSVNRLLEMAESTTD